MKKVTGICSDTRVDLQGMRLRRDCVDRVVSINNRQYTPLYVQHESTKTPVGRIERVWRQEASDGEVEIHFEAILFEPDDHLSDLRGSTERCIPVLRSLGDQIGLMYTDNTDLETLKLVKELENAGVETQAISQKAFDPASYLLIVVSAIAGGVPSEMGADIYHFLKNKIEELFLSRRESGKQIPTLRVVRTVIFQSRDLEIEIVADSRLEGVLTQAVGDAIRDVLNCLNEFDDSIRDLGVKKIVFTLDENGVIPSHAIGYDAIPYKFDYDTFALIYETNIARYPGGVAEYTKGMQGLSISIPSKFYDEA